MNGRLLISVVVLAMAAAACAPAGDDPVEDPTPSTTSPGDVTTDSLAYNPAAPDYELGVEEAHQEEPVEAEDAESGEQSAIPASAPNDTPTETGEPEAPAPDPDLPAAALDDGWPNQPRYPDIEKVVPPPRD